MEKLTLEKTTEALMWMAEAVKAAEALVKASKAFARAVEAEAQENLSAEALYQLLVDHKLLEEL